MEPEEGTGRIPPGTRPSRHIDPRSRREEAPSNGMTDVLSLAEIERRIIVCDDELARLVDEHYLTAEGAASAEADWKQHRDKCLVLLADSGTKEAADLREARAKRTRVDPSDARSILGEDLYRIFLIKAAQEKSIDRHLRAVQSRMSGLQSLARGIRSVT